MEKPEEVEAFCRAFDGMRAQAVPIEELVPGMIDGTTPWIKASMSDTGTSCVEQRRHEGMIEVRDTKDRGGPVLRFRPDEFVASLDGAKRGEFDHLA
ncbi:DUF397 domain-containing protein [Pseudonocardia lacus]|uniref:DUF397 domain-containing protein n=1 Tax=Pseudonocardia lacus TaxID=2835865 RepID=UPI0027E33B89|nr:DUF397 domain-containing protein [Pseudonocardia lacus]